MAEQDENPFDAIEQDLMESLAQVGGFMAEQVQEWISVDDPPRSKPGEHPHRDTTRLFQSIQHEISAQDHVITITVDTDVPYAVFLEFGTSSMEPRPIFVGLLEKYEPILLDTAASVISGDESVTF